MDRHQPSMAVDALTYKQNSNIVYVAIDNCNRNRTKPKSLAFHSSLSSLIRAHTQSSIDMNPSPQQRHTVINSFKPSTSTTEAHHSTNLNTKAHSLNSHLILSPIVLSYTYPPSRSINSHPYPSSSPIQSSLILSYTPIDPAPPPTMYQAPASTPPS